MNKIITRSLLTITMIFFSSTDSFSRGWRQQATHPLARKICHLNNQISKWSHSKNCKRLFSNLCNLFEKPSYHPQYKKMAKKHVYNFVNQRFIAQQGQVAATCKRQGKLTQKGANMIGRFAENMRNNEAAYDRALNNNPAFERNLHNELDYMKENAQFKGSACDIASKNLDQLCLPYAEHIEWINAKAVLGSKKGVGGFVNRAKHRFNMWRGKGQYGGVRQPAY